MSKKFEDIVNTPHRAFKQAKYKLLGAQWPRDNKKRAGHVAKIGGLGLLQFITWMTKYVTLDNHLTRKLEDLFGKIKRTNKDGQEKLWRAFIKKNPNFMGHVVYYMMIVLTAAGVDLSRDDSFIKETVKEWVVDLTGKNKLDNFVINPNVDDAQWESQMDAISPYVIAHIFSTEGYIQRAYYDDGGKGTLTFGAGFTINDTSHRNFAKKVLGRSVGNGEEISVDETKKLTYAWCREKIYPKMKKQFTAAMPARTFISLVVAAFNAGENTFATGNSGAPVRDAVNSGKSTEEIANLFVRQYGKQRGTKWGGMPNKYAIGAMYMLGKVSDEAILNAISEAPYTLESILKRDSAYLSVFDAHTMEKGRLLVYDTKSGKSKAHGFIELDNINQLLQQEKNRETHGTKQEPVKNYMDAHEVELMQQGRIFLGKSLDSYHGDDTKKEPVIEVSLSQKLNEEGEILFFDGKYQQAIVKFEEALKEDAKNYIVYSNLSIAHYKNNDYQSGLDVVQRLINSKYFAQMPNHIKAYTYYNAALCREKLGDSASASDEKYEHYDMAKKNIELAKQKSGQDYSGFLERLNKKQGKSGRTKLAFGSGARKIRQQNAAHDVLIYGQERKMA